MTVPDIASKYANMTTLAKSVGPLQTPNGRVWLGDALLPLQPITLIMNSSLIVTCYLNLKKLQYMTRCPCL